MHPAKKLALGLLSPLFILLLFATAIDVGFVRTATNPTTVKRLVSESGLYSTVVPSLLKQAKTISTDSGDVSATAPIIEKAASGALTPQYIQQNTEAVLDNVYSWLDGDIEQPNFIVDLATVKTSFADKVASGVKAQLATLPPCKTAAQVRSFNALNATCLPKGVSPAEAAADVKKSILSGEGFLDQNKLTSADIKNEDSGKTVFNDQLKKVPEQYQKAKKTPLILSLLTILVGVALVFLNTTWQRGLRHVGVLLVIIGMLMLIFSWTLNWGVNKKAVPKIKVENAVLQQDVRNLATDLTQQIDKNYWFFGGLYTVLGAGSIAATEVFKRRNQPEAARQHKSITEAMGELPKTPKKSDPGK